MPNPKYAGMFDEMLKKTEEKKRAEWKREQDLSNNAEKISGKDVKATEVADEEKQETMPAEEIDHPLAEEGPDVSSEEEQTNTPLTERLGHRPEIPARRASSWDFGDFLFFGLAGSVTVLLLSVLGYNIYISDRYCTALDAAFASYKSFRIKNGANNVVQSDFCRDFIEYNQMKLPGSNNSQKSEESYCTYLPNSIRLADGEHPNLNSLTEMLKKYRTEIDGKIADSQANEFLFFRAK